MKKATRILISAFCFISLLVATDAQGRERRDRAPKSAIFNRARDITVRNSLAQQIGEAAVFKLLKKIRKMGGCDVGICFALDGSGSINADDYAVQKEFVKLIADIASFDDRAGFSAVQYGLANIGISPLTTNEEEFLENVDKSSLASAPRTFLAAGLGFCIQDLRRSSRMTGKRIIVLGDGRSNFAEGLLDSVVKQVVDERVFAVGVGFPTNAEELLKLTGGDVERVYNVQGYPMMGGIAAEVVLAACRE